MHLTDRSLHRVHTALQQLHPSVPLDAFPQQALSALAEAVPADVSAYNEVNLQTRRMRAVGVPEELRFASDTEIWMQHLHEHPTLAYTQRTGDGSAHKISDFLTQRQFRRLALYNDVYRRLDGEYHMSMSWESSSLQIIAFAFNRGTKDFSEQDRNMLNLLRPYLMQVYQQAEAASQLQRDMEMLRRAFDALDCGVVIVTLDGKVQSITQQAERWLQHYCGTDAKGWSHGLPDIVQQWLRDQSAAATSTCSVPQSKPLSLERLDATLSLRCLIDREAERLLILMQEQRRDFCPEQLAPLGLSKRECEILYWLMQGKTNPEIAAFLGLSTGTVRTRLEDIFRKLGVQTRTAAAMRARELLVRLGR
jgi:DNA-binding CsgD family transcriptional regulator/PAS domain-containing protein